MVLEWPENNFRGEYARLGELRTRLPGVPMLASSATATSAMWNDIGKTLKLSEAAHKVARGSIYRSNLVLRVKVKNDSSGSWKRAALQPLAEQLAKEANGEAGTVRPTIIYQHRVSLVHEVQKELRSMLDKLGGKARGIAVEIYIGNNMKEAASSIEWANAERSRAEVLRGFLEGRVAVVVANEAFGMGINHPNVRRIEEV